MDGLLLSPFQPIEYNNHSGALISHAFIGRALVGKIIIAPLNHRELLKPYERDVPMFIVESSGVYQPYQKQGIGLKLYQHAIDYATKHLALCLPSCYVKDGFTSVHAKRIWRKLGYSV